MCVVCALWINNLCEFFIINLSDMLNILHFLNVSCIHSYPYELGTLLAVVTIACVRLPW